MNVFIGLFFGLLIGAFSVVKFFEGDINAGYKANKTVEECQKTLPRNVGCVIVAVPETEIEEE